MRWMLLAMMLVVGVASAAKEKKSEYRQAHAEVIAALQQMARQEFTGNLDSAHGRMLLAVLESVGRSGKSSGLAKELEKGVVRPPTVERGRDEFAVYITERAGVIRNRATVNRTDLAIIPAKVALVYAPELQAAKDLVPRDDMRVSLKEMLGASQVAVVHGAEFQHERQDDRDLALILTKVEVSEHVFLASDPSRNLNNIIKLAYGHKVPLKVEFERMRMASAGSYHGQRLYRVNELTGPRVDVTMMETNLLTVVNKFCSTHRLAWHANNGTLVITEVVAASATRESDVAGGRSSVEPKESVQRRTYSGADLRTSFEGGVSSTLSKLRGDEVRVRFVVSDPSSVRWRNKVLLAEDFRLDMYEGAPEDVARCQELAEAIEKVKGKRGNRVQLIVTGEVYNYVSGVIYIRKPNQLRWEWVKDKDRR